MERAIDLYYYLDDDKGVQERNETADDLCVLPECNGKVGTVGYRLGGKMG